MAKNTEINIFGSSSGSKELNKYLTNKFPGFKIYGAYANNEIFVGYLRKPDDFTWNDVKTYYWNCNFDIEEVSVKDVKI